MPSLTILFDGACPLCRREVTLLSRRDRALHGDAPRLAFVDIDDPAYDPAAHGGISYREAMGRIHALDAEGGVLRDVAVFRRAYELVGLGWIYAPSRWPLLGGLADALYRLWAAVRLRLTGRPSLDDLCRARRTCRQGSCRLPTPTAAESALGSAAQ
jgi:predicted DCC family thiol-disulfide oxidoreductase YuxK